ncbi:MAG: hypothetical protein PHW31_03680 [Candidatus Pacebacteria bacterium]|nr:hypothetical protein [Candidatus Paceibacterota bacterium]
MRKINFVNGEYYHIYNRGANKQNVFIDEKDYWKFIDCLRDLNNETYYEERLQAIGYSNDLSKEPSSLDFKQLRSFLVGKNKVVDVVVDCIIDNHYHMILRQLVEKGVSNLMHKVGLSYTNCFNKKYNHSGHVFQGPFKAIHIDNNDYLLWLAGYICGNTEIHKICEAKGYDWSSYRVFLEILRKSKEPGSLDSLSPFSVLSGFDVILSQFKNADEFESFVKSVIRESKTKKEMGEYLLEDINL